MKGFKPTGYGPSVGFKFPARMGFTGSTGAYTNVQPYVRRVPQKFADGGFVRQDNPRMTQEMTGDSGSALVRRARPYTAEDQESGGKSPLRPGFRKGGKVKRGYSAGGRRDGLSDGRSPDVARTARAMTAPGHGPLSQMRTNKRIPPPGAIKGKFMADGGQVEKPTYMRAVKDRIKEMLRMEGETSTGMAKKAADKISGRQKQIDDIVDSAQTGTKTSASNYARGGRAKAKRGMMSKC